MCALIRQVEQLAPDDAFESRNEVLELDGDALATELNEKVEAASERYGYRQDQVTLRLYVGRFAAPTKGTHEQAIREWATTQHVGSGPIEVYGLGDVTEAVRTAAASKTYRDNPVLVTMEVLDAAGLLVGVDMSATE